MHQASDDALDLLANLVTFDPRKRMTAAEALGHPYFKNAPKPSEASRLPKPPIRAHNPLKLQAEVNYRRHLKDRKKCMRISKL